MLRLRCKHILGNLDRYLSACQLGITLASLILGALGEPAVSVLMLAAADAVGLPIAAGSGWVSIVSIGLAFTVITTLHMTVGEQAPKMWALRRPESMALATGPTLRAFGWVFGPFIGAINSISNWLLRLIGLPADLGHETSHSAEEIRSILSLSARSGRISEHEFELTENVFRMIELEVRHIVVPRVEIDFLTLEHTLEENLERIRTSGHSRFALCELGLDTIVGIVHAKDVLDATLRGETPDLAPIAREPVFVPDTMPLSNFLRELQTSRQHCAVVVDEHGTAIGLAFREDALEEVVGPLGDEFDDEERDIFEPAAGVFEVRGRIALPEIEDRLRLRAWRGRARRRRHHRRACHRRALAAYPVKATRFASGRIWRRSPTLRDGACSACASYFARRPNPKMTTSKRTRDAASAGFRT